MLWLYLSEFVEEIDSAPTQLSLRIVNQKKLAISWEWKDSKFVKISLKTIILDLKKSKDLINVIF